jgi:GNAT superfamily N-acetyltransferase
MSDITDRAVRTGATGTDVVFTRDAFDSELLGLEIGRITEVPATSTSELRALFDRLLVSASAEGYDQVLRRSALGNLQEIWALEGSGFELMDVGVTFGQRVTAGTRPVAGGGDCNGDLRIALSTDEAVEAIVHEMVLQPWGSRYEADPAYDVERVRALRRQWLLNSHRGRAHAFFVGWLDGRPAGYVTCLVDADARTGEVELVGTLPGFRGRRVAPRILENALAWFSARVDFVTVRTQATNFTAAALYGRAGFTLHASDMTFRAGRLAERRYA